MYFLNITRAKNIETLQFSKYIKPKIPDKIELEISWHPPEQNISL